MLGFFTPLREQASSLDWRSFADSRQVRSAYPLYGGIHQFSVAARRSRWLVHAETDGRRLHSIKSRYKALRINGLIRFMTAVMPGPFPAGRRIGGLGNVGASWRWSHAARRADRRGGRPCASRRSTAPAAPGARRAASTSVRASCSRTGTARAGQPRQSRARRRARLQRPRHRGHRRRWPLHAAAAGGSDDLRHQAGGLHAAGRARRPICRASTAIISPRARRRAQPDLRGPRADRAFARLGRFPASPPGRAQRVRRRDVDRSAAGDRTPKSTSFART